MNGSLAANAALLAGIREGLSSDKVDVAVCVPAPYLFQVQELTRGTVIASGAQDMSAHEAGAYTGELAASMLKEFGCGYVIVGHSERRAYHGESDKDVADKAAAALKSGLVPIVCVGETLAEREAGKTGEVVSRQLAAILAGLDVAGAEKIVVAYEPVWAIGTGKTATPEMAQEVHALLRQQLAAKAVQVGAAVRILYGGSMKPDNAQALLQQADIDGGLIGGAALKAGDFLAIIAAAGN